jgi:uncharacterized protein YukE
MTPETYRGEHPATVALQKVLEQILKEIRRQGKMLEELAQRGLPPAS